MLKKTIPGKNGYDIPCLLNVRETDKRVVIICHGFGGSKDNKTAGVFETLPEEYGLGVICFDFPAHGESRAALSEFSVANCISDLDSTVSHARALAPKAERVFFSTSFGAFITILYLAEFKDLKTKAFLRSGAFRMPQIVKNSFLHEETHPDENGIIELQIPVVGTVKVPEKFIKELQGYDVFRFCSKDMAKFFLMHGDEDNISPVSDAQEFAKLTGAKLKTIQGASHFEYPGGIKQAVREAVDFYRADMIKNLSIREVEDIDIQSAFESIWGFFIENEAPKSTIKAAIGLRKRLEKEIKNYGIRIIGAYEDGKLFGGILLRKDLSKISLLEVDKEHLGCGVVQMLFNAVLRSCCSGSISVLCPSFTANMYRDLGFNASADPLIVDGITLVHMNYQMSLRKRSL